MSDPSGAAERLAAYVDGQEQAGHEIARGVVYGQGPREAMARLRADVYAVLAELSRLRADLDAAHRDGWDSAMETVAEERRRECEDVARLEAEVTRLREALEAEQSYVKILRGTAWAFEESTHLLTARIDAALRLCDEADAMGHVVWLTPDEIRAVLSPTGEPEAEAAP